MRDYICEILKECIEDSLRSEYKIINMKPISGDDTNGHIDNLIRLESSNYLYYNNSYSILSLIDSDVIESEWDFVG